MTKTQYPENTITIKHFSMTKGVMVSTTLPREDYKRLVTTYEENATVWKRNEIETADDFVRLVLSFH